MAYVYIHKRKDNNQPFYVGVGGLLSFDNYQRANANNWKGLRNRSEFWKNIVNKFGFIVEIVLDNCTKKEAFLEEVRLIKLYGRQDISTGILVNHTAGGEGRIDSSDELKKKCGAKNIGRKWTEDRRNRIKKVKIKHNRIAWNKGIPATEKTKENLRLAAKNKPPVSELTKLKIGKAHKGKIITQEQKDKLGKKVIDISTGIIYSSCTDAAKFLNIPRGTLNSRLIGKCKNNTTFKYL
jgi:hypothetical protein